MILDPIDQNIRNQGFNFVPFDRYLADPFKPYTLDMSGGISTLKPPIFPIPRPGGGGGDGDRGGGLTTAPDTSGFDYETDAYGLNTMSAKDKGLTEEEQTAIDDINNPATTKGMLGTAFAATLGLMNPFTAIASLAYQSRQQKAKAEQAARDAAIQADFEREAAKGNRGADFTGGRYDGADTRSDYDADPTSFSGSSKDGGIIGYGGTSGTPLYQQFMNGGLADLVDIYD